MVNEDLYAPIREKYQRLQNVLEGEDLQSIIELALEVHAMVYPGIASGLGTKTISDYVLDYMLQSNHKEELVPRMDCEIDLDWAGTQMRFLCAGNSGIHIELKTLFQIFLLRTKARFLMRNGEKRSILPFQIQEMP